MTDATRTAEETAPSTETGALIDHILTRYHVTHRDELEWLVPLADKVETVHADHAQAPVGLTQVLIDLSEDLESHMRKEEQVLFPMMRAGGHPMIAQPIAVMRHDHDVADDLVARLMQVTGGLSLPADACHSWRRLYAGLQMFTDDLSRHIRLENEVLFPRFEAN